MFQRIHSILRKKCILQPILPDENWLLFYSPFLVSQETRNPSYKENKGPMLLTLVLKHGAIKNAD